MKILCFLLLLILFIPHIFDVCYIAGPDVLDDEYMSMKIQSEFYADSVLNTLSLEEKISQLMMLAVYPDKKESHYKAIEEWVRDKKVGGIIFFRGNPADICRLSKRYSSAAEIPLFIAMDAEWGVSMRVDSIQRLPYAMTLGALTDNTLVREYGKLVGAQCLRLGINMNMAPVADVNNNPLNPVINYRAFGENKKYVAEKSVLYYMGLREAGIMSVGKHFPGHGNTDSDSHYELPEIYDSRNIIDSIHLYPFKELIKFGVPAFMIAHLWIPAIDSTKNLPSSLSPLVINELLKEEMKFNGLIITDALGMDAVSKFFKPGETEVKALLAGNDILLMPQNPYIALDSIVAAVKDKRIEESLIDEKCRKILRYKYLYLEKNKNLLKDCSDIPKEINNEFTEDLIYRIYSNSMTLLINRDASIPLKNTEGNNLTVVSIGATSETEFVRTLKKSMQIKHLTISKDPKEIEINRTVSAVGGAQNVIVCLYGMNNSAKRNYGISSFVNRLLNRILKNNNVIVILFGNPYGLNFLKSAAEANALIIAYEETIHSERAVANGITGDLPFVGKLPVSSCDFKAGTGIITKKHTGLKIVCPSEIEINIDALKEIDSIVKDAIEKEAMPGCQIVLAYDGKVFLNKSYGYHTYEKKQKVNNSDLYDLASLTKILATTAAVMKLFEEGKISPTDKFQEHLPLTKGSFIGELTLEEVLLHQSGLSGWIPFFLKIAKPDSVRSLYLSNQYTPDFSIPVADNLWLSGSYKDTVYNIILNSKQNKKVYRYSDIGFYLLKELVESVAEEAFDKYLQRTFYEPMKLNTLTFNPLNRFPRERIVPTEEDTLFRKQLIHGYVHDPGAAMLGGTAGHAGLFSSAMDVAAFMQMLIDYGKYAGVRYFDTLTVVKFTSKQYAGNRRGLGFDKPAENPKDGNASQQASEQSFGHTGFTGTFAWADPKHKLIVVFLSNRIHPSADNNKLSEMEIRTKIHKFAYEAINVQNK